MKTILRAVAAVLAGVILGSVVNMGLVMLGPLVISVPEGVNVADMESLKANMHLFEMRHFIFPFLAHALGTLVGALVAFKVAKKHKMVFAMVIGGFFLIGGIANVLMLPSPAWFIAIDLIGAYLPMAYLGGQLAQKCCSK